MNQIFDEPNPPPAPRFTEKQGQYLAFIWAYTRIIGRPPPRRTCNDTSASHPPPSTR